MLYEVITLLRPKLNRVLVVLQRLIVLPEAEQGAAKVDYGELYGELQARLNTKAGAAKAELEPPSAQHAEESRNIMNKEPK